MSLQDELVAVVAEIVKLKAELNRLRNSTLENHLGAPTTSDTIARAEQELVVKFPLDYRQFLLLHDGWVGFNGQNDLLSLSDMRGGPMRKAIDALKTVQREEGDPAAAGIVIEASQGDTDMAYFDPSSRRDDGSMDVVRWDGREYRRYATFLDFLVGFARSLERRIQKQRLRVR